MSDALKETKADDWLFVLRERDEKSSWWLKLSLEEEILRFFTENQYFSNDKTHYLKLKN